MKEALCAGRLCCHDKARVEVVITCEGSYLRVGTEWVRAAMITKGRSMAIATYPALRIIAHTIRKVASHCRQS